MQRLFRHPRFDVKTVPGGAIFCVRGQLRSLRRRRDVTGPRGEVPARRLPRSGGPAIGRRPMSGSGVRIDLVLLPVVAEPEDMRPASSASAQPTLIYCSPLG